MKGDKAEESESLAAHAAHHTLPPFRPALRTQNKTNQFDALGAARGAAAGGDESASIINELLVQMDGFEDNRGVVVLGATNRPGAIDAALVRPGRFDRIIYMPLPDAEGRAKILQVRFEISARSCRGLRSNSPGCGLARGASHVIMPTLVASTPLTKLPSVSAAFLPSSSSSHSVTQVHARNKAVDPTINWPEVARSMAGFTGAGAPACGMQHAHHSIFRAGALVLCRTVHAVRGGACCRP